MKRIHPIKLPFQLPMKDGSSVPRLVYAYIVQGDDSLILIDAGVKDNHEALLQALADLGATASDVDWIVNTHAHPDHAGGNLIFQEKFGTPIACHGQAARWVEDMDLQARERPVFGFEQLVAGSTRVKWRLQEGDVIDLGGLTLEVIHTPGHAPGLISLFCQENGNLFAGDVIPPTMNLPLYYDVPLLRQSLQKLLQWDGIRTLYHSHVTAPYVGQGVAEALSEGLRFLERMNEVVAQARAKLGADAPLEDVTRESLLRLGFEKPPVMPLTMITVQACLKEIAA